MLTMTELFSGMVKKGASDLHITTGAAPTIRVDGSMLALVPEKLTAETAQTLIYSILTDAQRKTFESDSELDLAFQVPDVGRVRGNVFRQRGTVAAAFRIIPVSFPSLDELGLPDIVSDLIKLPKGLVLVTGPTGAGKSTSIAAMINRINENRACHIITIEDPIEFIHPHKKAIVDQREVGSDTHTFGDALKYVLRQDPDVILIGEMRDLETTQAALNLAETGHLIFATLHTNDCPSAINRIVDLFPSTQQEQARAQLSAVLQAVISQILIPKASGKGRVLACEALISTPAVRHLVRDGKTEQIYTLLQTGGREGMQTMNKSLVSLVQKHLITRQEALEHSLNPKDLEALLAEPAS